MTIDVGTRVYSLTAQEGTDLHPGDILDVETVYDGEQLLCSRVEFRPAPGEPKPIRQRYFLLHVKHVRELAGNEQHRRQIKGNGA